MGIQEWHPVKPQPIRPCANPSKHWPETIGRAAYYFSILANLKTIIGEPLALDAPSVRRSCFLPQGWKGRIRNGAKDKVPQPLYAFPTVFFAAKTRPKRRISASNRTKTRQKAPKNHPRRRANRLRINNLPAFAALENSAHCKTVRRRARTFGCTTAPSRQLLFWIATLRQ